MKKLFILFVFIGFLLFGNSVFAENIIPDSLNQCLKVKLDGADNFVFSPDGKNFAYTMGNSIYKNGQKIDELQSFMEIKNIIFKDDNETILVFANGTFSKPQYTKNNINYYVNGFIIDYPTKSNWIDKRYGEIVLSKHSKDGKSYAFINSYYLDSTYNKQESYLIKDGKEIGPFDNIIDFGYTSEKDFYYEYKLNSKYCINLNGIDKCDEKSIKNFKDTEYEKYLKNNNIEVYFGGEYNSKKYFKAYGKEIGPFDILSRTNIIQSNDKKIFALTNIKDNLIFCDSNFQKPTTLNYLKDVEKNESSKKLYEIYDLDEYIYFLPKIPNDFKGNLLEFIKKVVQEEIVDEDIIKIHQNETGDFLIITKKINNKRDGYEIKFYKNFIQNSYGFDEKYLSFKYGEKSISFNEYHDIFFSNDFKNLAIIFVENGKKKLFLNGKLVAGFDNIWNVAFDKNGNNLAFLAKVNNKNNFITVINNDLKQIELPDNFTNPKITKKLDLYFIIGNTVYKNNIEFLKSNSDISYYKISEKGDIIYRNKNNEVFLNKTNLFKSENGNKYFATLDEDMSNIINIFYDKNNKYQIMLNGKIIDNNKYDYIDYNAFYFEGNLYYIVEKDNKRYLYANGKKILSDDFENIIVFEQGKPLITYKNGYYTLFTINKGQINKISIEEISRVTNKYPGVKAYGKNILFYNEEDMGYSTEGKLVILNENNTLEIKEEQSNINLKSKYLKQKILSLSVLKKGKQEKYITKIDKIVERTDDKKLKQILSKIQKIKKKNDVINYLEATIYLKVN